MKWWDSGNYGRLSREIADEDAKWRIVCRVLTRQYTSIAKDGTEPWPEGKANFRLILNAPELAQVLHELLQQVDAMTEYYESGPCRTEACQQARELLAGIETFVTKRSNQ